MITSFGALPVGTRFSVVRREKDPADRRRYVSVVRWYMKTAHGTIAGYATKEMYGEHDSQRFEHSNLVTITDDLRLIVSVLRNASNR